MKSPIQYLALFILSFLFVSCSDDESLEPSIQIDIATPVTIGAKVDSKVSIQFSSTHDWQASTDASWLVLTPIRGVAGTASVNVLVKEDNLTGSERNATITIAAGGIVKEISVQQQAVEVLLVEKNVYQVSEEAQILKLPFSTNVEGGKVVLENMGGGDASWIVIATPTTRALYQHELSLQILENTKQKERTASVVVKLLDEITGKTLVKSSLITIKQSPAPVGTSFDYSQDKKVTQLQKHSIGNGVPIVIVGDGFLDKDIANGFYLEAMKQGMNNFFSEEPVKSLREYFDVWTVNAVSQNNAFGSGYSTKFQCVLAGGGSTGIDGNHTMVQTYAGYVPEIASNPKLMQEVLVIVILNTDAYAGTTYFGFRDDSGSTNEFAIGYCPMINGIDTEDFRRVLCHECIGHGFAKLLDEYSYESQGVIPEGEVNSTRRMQKDYGWAMNVDFVSDRNLALWKHFLQDKRYKNADAFGEILGLYEGACTFWYGAYRPTNESMMRSNIHGFNAPSRAAIYKRVMRVAYGSVWQYNHEEFVAFDLNHLPQPVSTRSMEMGPSRPFASPRMVSEIMP